MTRISWGSRMFAVRSLIVATFLVSAGILLGACSGSAGGASRTTTFHAGDPDAQPGTPVELTLPTTTCQGLFVADVLVNGVGPYPMVVDTGASTTTITPRVKREAGVGGRMASVRLGDFETTNCRRKIKDIAHLSRALGTTIEGILGHDVFDGTTVTYDYGASELRVSNTSLRAGGEHVVATRPNNPRPFVRAHIDYDQDGESDGRFWLLVDTGSARSLSIRPFDDLRFQQDPVPIKSVVKYDGAYLVRGGRLAGDVSFGPVRLTEPIAESSPSTNILGYKVLQSYVLSVDKANDLARFVPLADEPYTDEPLRGIGVAMKRDSAFPSIARVFEGSAAQDAGLREGDTVVSINGMRTDENVCDPNRDPVGGASVATFEIERDGETLFFEVEIRVLVP